MDDHEKLVINEIIMKHQYFYIQMPPCHPDLKPGKKVWGEIKDKVAHHWIMVFIAERTISE